MVEMVAKNARIELERFNEEMRKAEGVKEALKELSAMLGLDGTPGGSRLMTYQIQDPLK